MCFPVHLERIKGIIASKARAFKPDIILLDIVMPGMDGLKACEELSRDNIGKSIPIIILSALAGDRDKLSACNIEIADYVTKPVGKDELILRIEKALLPK